MTSNFFKNAHAAVLMFGLDDVMSFNKMELEVQNAKTFIDKDFLWVVVGNKSDLARDPHITEARVEAFSATLGSSQWVYMSVKTGDNVECVLETVAREIYRVHHGSLCKSTGERDNEDTVQLLSTEANDDTVMRKKTCRPQSWTCETL